MAYKCLLLARSVCERMGIGSSGRAHDHDLCVIMTATTIKYTAAILPMVGSTKSHPVSLIDALCGLVLKLLVSSVWFATRS